MNWKITDARRFWNLISAVILLLGMGSAIAIYATAPAESDDAQGYRIVGGKMYPVVPTKMYVRNLELYGDKGLVLYDDMTRWFDERWHGKALGVTIAWISVFTAAVIYFFNNYVTFEDDEGDSLGN